MIRMLLGCCVLTVSLTLAVGCNDSSHSSGTSAPGVQKSETKTSGHKSAPQLDAPAKLPEPPQ